MVILTKSAFGMRIQKHKRLTKRRRQPIRRPIWIAWAGDLAIITLARYCFGMARRFFRRRFSLAVLTRNSAFAQGAYEWVRVSRLQWTRLS